MAESHLIPVDQTGAWCDALARCKQFDTYHLPGYHLVAKHQGEGEPYLFFFEHDGRYAALPFLLRSVAEVDGLSECKYRDAASVYGYPGLVTSVGLNSAGADAFRSRFQASLHETMESLGVITFFGRQNPLIDSSWLFPPETQSTAQAPTVAIDLTRPEDEQFQDMRENHRRDIRRARGAGMIVREDPEFESVDTFRCLYDETMERAGATDFYFFPKQYFTNLKRYLSGNVKLLFSEQDGNVVSGSMFLLTGNIIQYHLSGTATEFLKCRGGVKFILDEVRAWGSRNGFAWLHLGGGLGSREDSLFQFKAGFSKTRHSFRTVKMVLEPEVYRQLIRRRTDWVHRRGFTASCEEYFPAYRQPCIRRAA